MQRANDSSLGGNDKYEGYCADLAKMIAEHVGFSYEIRPVVDGKYGQKNDNNVWNGIVGELVRRVSEVHCKRITRFMLFTYLFNLFVFYLLTYLIFDPHVLSR